MRRAWSPVKRIATRWRDSHVLHKSLYVTLTKPLASSLFCWGVILGRAKLDAIKLREVIDIARYPLFLVPLILLSVARADVTRTESGEAV